MPTMACPRCGEPRKRARDHRCLQEPMLAGMLRTAAYEGETAMPHVEAEAVARGLLRRLTGRRVRLTPAGRLWLGGQHS